jgi:TRAP-type C4-dicarboxylate transport system permease small subunit
MLISLLNKAIDNLLSLMALFAGMLLLFITFTICYSILSRITGLPSFLWILQFNEYALLWITFLGTAWVLKRNKHVSIDLVTGRFSQSSQTWFRLFHCLLGLALCLVFLWYSAQTTFEQYQRNVIDVQAVDISKYMILVIIPIGFFALVLQFVRQFFVTIEEVRRRSKNNFPGDQGA